MSRESERREKIISLIKDLALGISEKDYKVPAPIGDFILQQYGLCPKTKPEDVSDHEMNGLVNKLEKLISAKYEEGRKRAGEQEGGVGTNAEHNFMKACETFTKAKNEYIRITLDLNSLLNEIDKFKVKYCNYLKDKAAAKQDELEVLEKKIQLLKGESLLKLYTEKNAFNGHLKLMEILTGKLKELELSYNELIELDATFNELKNNKVYCDLLATYKHLLTREKKLDYMIEK